MEVRAVSDAKHQAAAPPDKGAEKCSILGIQPFFIGVVKYFRLRFARCGSFAEFCQLAQLTQLVCQAAHILGAYAVSICLVRMLQ